MADGYGIPASDTIKMFADAHNTNWAENFQFFLNQNNPTNFERVWTQAYYLYRRIGSISHSPVSFDKVMDYSIIEKLGNEPKYRSQTRRIRSASGAKGGLADSCRIGRNSHQHDRHSVLPQRLGFAQEDESRGIDGKIVEVLYDPNVDNVLEEVGQAGRPVRRGTDHRRRAHR